MKNHVFYAVEDLPAQSVLDIFGAGGAGISLATELRSRRPDCRIERFVDTFQGPGILMDLPVVCASEIHPDQYRDKLLVIASTYHQEIMKQLAQSGHSILALYLPEEGQRIKGSYAVAALAPEIIEDGMTVARDFSCLADISARVFIMGPKSNDAFRLECIREVHERCDRVRAAFTMPGYIDGPGQVATLLGQRSVVGEPTLLYNCGCDPLTLLDVLLALQKDGTLRSTLYLERPPSGELGAVAVREKRVVYVPIPKCGASSMVRHLRLRFEKGFMEGSPDHRTCLDSILTTWSKDDPDFAGFFSFSVVRNPFNRLASLYNSYKVNGQLDRAYVFQFMRNSTRWQDLSFRSFCELACACPDEFAEHHFKSQSYFLNYAPEHINQIFHLERLREEASDTLESLGIGLPSQKANVSNSNYIDYADSYDPSGSLRKLVRQRYALDYESFGYA